MSQVSIEKGELEALERIVSTTYDCFFSLKEVVMTDDFWTIEDRVAGLENGFRNLQLWLKFNSPSHEVL